MKSPEDTYLGVIDPEIGTCTYLPESTYDVLKFSIYYTHFKQFIGPDMAPTWPRQIQSN